MTKAVGALLLFAVSYDMSETEEVLPVSIFESLIVMIQFATLVVVILSFPRNKK